MKDHQVTWCEDCNPLCAAGLHYRLNGTISRNSKRLQSKWLFILFKSPLSWWRDVCSLFLAWHDRWFAADWLAGVAGAVADLHGCVKPFIRSPCSIKLEWDLSICIYPSANLSSEVTHVLDRRTPTTEISCRRQRGQLTARFRIWVSSTAHNNTFTL